MLKFTPKTKPNAYVLVDACNSGKMLADAFRKYIDLYDPGAILINVETIDYSDPKVRLAAPERNKFDKTYVVNENFDLTALKKELSEYNIKAIPAGQEPGVETADTLSKYFSLPTSNGTALSEARRNKYVQIKAVADAGLAAPLFTKSNNYNEILAWAKTPEVGFPEKRVVLKVLRSAGSDGVYICNNEDELLAAFNKSIDHTTIMGEKNSAVLVESYLDGPEYVVNSVSLNGEHHVIDIWRYEKTFLNGRRIYDKERLISPSSEEAQQLIAYNSKMLDALGIANGPSHAEIILTKEQGPTLVEVAARVSGVVNPGLNDQCIALLQNQIDLTALCYVSPKHFIEAVCNSPCEPHKEAMVVNLINEDLEGYIVETNQDVLDKIRAIPSVLNLILRKDVGAYLTPTEDLMNSPMRLFMRGTAEELDRDYLALQELKKSLYRVSPYLKPKPVEPAPVSMTFTDKLPQNTGSGIAPNPFK